MLANTARRQVHHLGEHALEARLLHLARAVQVDVERQRLGHADGIGELDGAALGEARGHDILGEVARCIGSRPVHLGRILAGEGAAGLAKRCTIQLSYAIGVAEPLSLYVDTHGTGTVEDAKIEAVLPKLVRLTPKGIRTHLGLNKAIYEPTAAYGHFGRKPDGDLFTWEKTDLVEPLKSELA
jgi:hypothetical protein